MGTSYSDFKDIVLAHAQQGGVTYLDPSDDTAYLAHINRGLKSFTRYAHSHIDLAQTLALTSGTYTYDITPMFSPLKMAVGGVWLRNLDGRIAPASLGYLATLDLTTTGTPTLWAISGDQQITIYPNTTATATLVGYVEHTTIASTGLVTLPDHIIDVAALWVATISKYPHMQGSDLFQQVLALDKFGAQKLKGYRSENMARFNTPFTRKTRIETYYV